MATWSSRRRRRTFANRADRRLELLFYLAVCVLGGLVCFLLGAWPRFERAALLVALSACLLAALLLDPAERLLLGDGQLVASRYLQLWLAAGAAASLLLVLVVAERLSRNASLALLGGWVAMALALAAVDHGAAILLAAAGGAAVIPAAAASAARPGQELRLATDLLRSLAAAVALALLAIAALARDGLLLTPGVLAMAATAGSLAVVLRAGAVPFHRTSARTSEQAPAAVVPLLVAWLPATFVLVAFAWQEAAVRPLEVDLGFVPGVVALLGILTLALGAGVMLLQEDLRHLVGYSVVADVGFALLALSTAEPAAWPELRTFLLLFVLGKTAAVAFIVAVHGAYRTHQLAELKGWLRRAPTLGLALLGILLATYGWPGSLIFDARRELVELALPGGATRLVGLAAAWLSIAAWLRLAWIGLQRPSQQVAAGSGERPILPAPDRPVRLLRLAAPTDQWGRARERLIHGATLAAQTARQAPLAYRLNRTPIAALLVLVLAMLPLALAAGVADLAAAAAEPPPQTERSPSGS